MKLLFFPIDIWLLIAVIGLVALIGDQRKLRALALTGWLVLLLIRFLMLTSTGH